MDWQSIIDGLASWATTTGVRIFIALFILIVGFRLVTVITRKIERKLVGGKRKLDKTLTTTIFYIIRIVLKVVIVTCLVGYLGIDTSGITALIASLGVCVGLAVNGAVSNLAGGILIILTRPFKIDDYIEAQGHSGTVEDIHIISTRIRTPDNKVVYIPNGALSAGTIINYSEKDIRRVDFTFSISYAADFERAKSIILDTMGTHELVLKDPEPMARVSAHSASSIDITARAWVNSDDYWTVNFDLLEKVKTEFDKAGIEIPFNQLDVHVKND